MYTPPFEITSRIIELISVVSEKIGEIQYLQDSAQHIQLRKENRIKTIHASLAIENNSLSIEQITAIIEGKHILGNPNEIKEVKNSIQAYDLLLSIDPCSEKDLLKAHALMMRDLVGRSGKYRTDGVGIFDDETVVHLAPPAERVPALMSDLFAWLKASDAHPLIKSCVFHYEFEFIHPFQDGNGRMGRLWQTAILKDWKAIFAWLPVEPLVKEHQKEYYAALMEFGVVRFNALQRYIKGISFKTPSLSLKELEADKLIVRTEYPQIPPKVEYSLSARGKSLMPILDGMCAWGEKNRM